MRRRRLSEKVSSSSCIRSSRLLLGTGATRGAAIGHVSPEAAAGGNIALVEEGDIIAIDINNCSIELKVGDAELEERRKAWVCPEPKVKTGYLARYAKMVSSADKGAILTV